MNQFVVSARKYRPTTFKDVISQLHITTTLKNAIARNQLAHAFLFCGPRGVGKTTCARILAKAINCLNLTEATEPCNQCKNCISFATRSPMNIYELDAASNNSVEDIRELVEQVRYAPQMGKYKIYIIDEVHMLSNAAFNAFLKTLEEPPSYAIFILATTERYKILPTILSRCQIFNFNRIKPEDIICQLKIIATHESIAYEESALQLIAQKADGAMRDALSMFDLMVTSTGPNEKVSYVRARDYLQILDDDYYFKCTEAFLRRDISTILSLYDTILQAGFNGHHFITGLGAHLRNVLVCKDSATLPLLEVTDHVRPRYAELALTCSSSFLLRALTLLNQCDISYNSSQNQRLHVEIALIELTLAMEEASPEPPHHTLYPPQSNPCSDKSKQKLPTSPLPSMTQNSLLPKQQPEKINLNPYSQTKTPSVPSLKELKSTLSTKKHSSPSPADRELYNNPQKEIEEEVVQAFFNDYKEKLRKKKNTAGYHLMSQPIKIQGSSIILSLINPIQEEVLQQINEELLPQLRTKLNHPDIIIQGVLNCPPPQNKKPYTDQEKLNFLSKKNESIELFRQRFKLEIAY